MYLFGVFICTGLGVLNWTGVMYVLDWGLVYRMYCCTYLLNWCVV